MSEIDPNGKCQHESGAKMDKGKVRLGLVFNGFHSALLEIGKVGTFGAEKYTDNGWKEVPGGFNRYTDAMLRHLLKENIEDLDEDSGLLHASHVAWNALARLSLLVSQSTEKTIPAPMVQSNLSPPQSQSL